MRRVSFAVLFALLFVAPPVLAQPSPQHPRLLFTSADIPGLRDKVQDGVGGDDAAWPKLFILADDVLTKSFSNLPDAGYSETQAIELLGVAHQLAAEGHPSKTAYRDHCRTLALAMAGAHLSNGADGYTGGHRLFALSYALDMCFEGAPPADRAAIVAEIDAILRQFYWRWDYYHFPPYTSNKGLMAAAGMGMAAIVLQGEPVDPTHLTDAFARSAEFLASHMTSVTGSDGAYTEGVLYGAWSMRFLAPYFEARRRFDGTDLGAASNFTRMVEWMAYGIKPNAQARVENLNDTLASAYPLGVHSTLLEWAMYRQQSGIAAWIWGKEMPHHSFDSRTDVVATILWNSGLAAQNPGATLPKERVFPHRGLYYYRTGWPDAGQAESDDTVFSLYSGKFWGGHAQEDQGQFSLFAHGIDFVVDTGTSAMGKESRGHNVILIDTMTQPGEGDQHKAGSSIGTDGALVGWLLSPFADFVHARNKAAYDTHSEFNNANWPHPGDTWCNDVEFPVERADRFVLSVKRSASVPEYFAIFDDMRKDGTPHHYRWLLHSQRDNCFGITGDRVTISKSNSNCTSYCPACGELDVVFVSPVAPQLALDQDIYVLPEGNDDGDTRRLRADTTAIEPEYFVLLLPRAAEAEPAAVTRPATSGGHAARIVWPGTNVVDRVLFAQGGDMAAAEEVLLHGRAAVLRKTGGLYTRYSLSEGSLLQAGPLAVATVWESGTASVANDGVRITISDPAASYTLYGPGVTSVVDATGAAVPYLKVQKFVYINSDPPAGGGPEF